MNFSSENQNNFSSNKKKKSFFSSIFLFIKRKKSKVKETKNDDDLDHKLVYSLSPQKVPSIKQIRNARKVLTKKEKLIVNLLFLVIFIGLVFLVIRFCKNNLKVYPDFGGEYIEGMIGSPKNINPLYNSARDVDSDISRLVFSSLFKRDKDGGIVEDLASEYSVSENNLEYLVKIKDNVRWHHGDYLKADDIIFTFEAIENIEYGSPLRSSFVGVSIQKVDDFSVLFTLEEPYAPFLELLTFGILSYDLWSNIPSQNAFLNELNIKPIGSGPYKFKSLTKNKAGDIKDFTLVPNLDYYGQVPYIGKIVFKFYNNYNELVSALNSNQVNGISYLPYGLKSDLVSQNSLNFNKLNLPQITSVFLNRKKNSLLEDKNFRELLSKLIDKDKICNELFSGNAGVANGPILPNSSSFNNDIQVVGYNYTEANSSLDEAGWSVLQVYETDLSLIREVIQLDKEVKELESKMGEDKQDSEFYEEYQGLLQKLIDRKATLEGLNNWEEKKYIIENFSLADQDLLGAWRFKNSSDKNKKYDFLVINLTTVDLIDNIMVAEFIKSSWEAVGIRTTLKTINPNQVQSEIVKQKNFEALLLSQVLGSDQDNYAFWHSSQIGESGLNISEYKNKEVDKLLEETRLSSDLEDKNTKFKKFQEILNNDFPVIFLYYPTYSYVQNKKIKGFDFSSILNPADRFNNIANWYIKVNRKIEF